jgi:predicted ATPase
VITGGPGSGKTTLVARLEEMGYSCMHEISRQVILEAQQIGIDQLFLNDPLRFSERLLHGRLQQFEAAKEYKEALLFYDRGLPDVTAYMDYAGQRYPEHFSEVCAANIYDGVFVLPPWEAIYIQDNERYESYREAERIYRFLLKGYQKYKYDVHEVPIGDVEERITYILTQLNKKA